MKHGNTDETDGTDFHGTGQNNNSASYTGCNMPKELLRISARIAWTSAKVSPCHTGLETELSLIVNGSPFTITFDALPELGLFCVLSPLECVSILEFTSAERGWFEGGRYVVLLNDDDDCWQSVASV